MSTQNTSRNSNGYITGTYRSTKTGLLMQFRSSWEVEYMMLLDDDPSVHNYRYELPKIPYMDPVTRKDRIYHPDFIVYYIDGSMDIVEIKPFSKLKDPNVQAKKRWTEDFIARHFSHYGVPVRYVMITERDLPSRGDISKIPGLLDKLEEDGNNVVRSYRKNRKKACLFRH